MKYSHTLLKCIKPLLLITLPSLCTEIRKKAYKKLINFLVNIVIVTKINK